MNDEQTNKLLDAYVKLVRINNHVVMPRALKAMMTEPLAEIREILQSVSRERDREAARAAQSDAIITEVRGKAASDFVPGKGWRYSDGSFGRRPEQ